MTYSICNYMSKCQKMASLQIWSIVVIFYQSVLTLIISWYTLSCWSTPNPLELQEVTLMKLLYLYDPRVCGRLQFYNVTVNTVNMKTSSIMWPVRNEHATSFRWKISLLLSLHVVWLLLSIANVLYGKRSCGFYVALVPFTLTGVALLVVDCMNTGMFLRDLKYTKTEYDIISYISTDNIMCLEECPLAGGESTSRLDGRAPMRGEDTSWLALLFAYLSCRGVVQWLVNFWIVKDNFYTGLALHRLQQKETNIRKRRA